MIKSKNIRRILLFAGIVIFGLGIAEFRRKSTIFGIVITACGAMSIVLAFRKLKCVQCGKTLREVSAGLTNCPYCGTPYGEKENTLGTGKSGSGRPPNRAISHRKNAMSAPLKWCLDWNNLTSKERFLMGAPFVATEDRAYQDIVKQLDQRTENDLAEWKAYPEEVSRLATRISAALQFEKIWPSMLFLPDDPADIPLGLHFDFAEEWNMRSVAETIVEKKFGIKMGQYFWFELESLTYAEAVTQIAKRQAEQAIT